MDNANSLALARLGVGLASYAVPEQALKMIGLKGAAQGPYLARLFATREIALGALTLLAKPEHKPLLVKLGVAVDAADAGAGVIAWRSDAVSPALGVVLVGTALAAVGSGLASLAQD